jgi:hypothetical protein
MNQTGVASVGNNRHARRNLSPESISVSPYETASEAQQVFEPQRLEPQLRAELAQFARNTVIEEVIGGHHRHRCVPEPIVVRAKPPEKSQPIRERHAKVEDNCIRVTGFGFAEPIFGSDGGPDLVSFQSEHPGERFRDTLIIVHNQDGGWRRMSTGRTEWTSRGHGLIVTDSLESVIG